MISAIIITKNEEKMVEDCLNSLKWVDEIVLVDTGNTDNTNKVALKHNARIVSINTGTFSDWRNKGLKAAKGEWILYLDADERVTPQMKEEILKIVSDKDEKTEQPIVAYAIPRRNFILGKELKYGGWYPDYQKRLFLRNALLGWSGNLHEEPKIKGTLGHLKNPMLHLKHETFSEMVEKTNKWSEIEAKLMYDANHPPMNILRFITAMTREFWQRMIMKKAFLDGSIGISFAMYQVFSRFISYAKLWEMQTSKK